ncbi:hypothetical protein [uncultured Paraglaciecola sp.]|uniref:hypothetical protein n=1 Tax=uncultured Paraglaciecola sp. TaxID=1765024 RepID=UPI00260C37A6|nr:hypothetical protein [uncultured Paraglaciecola sp.]
MDVIDRMQELLTENSIPIDKTKDICKIIRYEFAGQLVYITKRPKSLHSDISKQLDLRGDLREIARQYSVSVNTVRRILNRRRKK